MTQINLSNDEAAVVRQALRVYLTRELGGSRRRITARAILTQLGAGIGCAPPRRGGVESQKLVPTPTEAFEAGWRAGKREQLGADFDRELAQTAGVVSAHYSGHGCV